MRFRVLGIAFSLVLVFTAVLIQQIVSKPKVQLGISSNDLQRQLGKPRKILTSDSLPRSAAGGMAYQDGVSGAPYRSQELPRIVGQAWYYPYGCLGTTCVLVYLGKDGRVERVFYGGT